MPIYILRSSIAALACLGFSLMGLGELAHASTHTMISSTHACKVMLEKFGKKLKPNRALYRFQNAESQIFKVELTDRKPNAGAQKKSGTVFRFSSKKDPDSAVSVRFMADGEFEHTINIQFKRDAEGLVDSYELGREVLNYLNTHSESALDKEGDAHHIDSYSLTVNDSILVRALNERLTSLLIGTSEKNPYWKGAVPRRPGDADESDTLAHEFESYLDPELDSYVPSTTAEEFQGAIDGMNDEMRNNFDRELEAVFAQTQFGGMFSNGGAWLIKIKLDMKDVDAGDPDFESATHLVYRYKIVFQRAY